MIRITFDENGRLQSISGETTKEGFTQQIQEIKEAFNNASS